LRLDWFGFAMLSLAIGALQMMLDRGEQLDWFGSAEIVVEALVAAVAFYMFLVHMLMAENPFISPDLFRNRNFVAGISFIFMIGIVLLTTLALLTPFLQDLLGYPVLTAGLMMAPRGLGTMIGMLFVGQIINRVDTRVLILAGLGLTAWALWDMTGFTPDVSQATIVRTGIVQGLGLGLVFVPMSTLTFSSLPAARIPEAAGLYNLMRNIGSSIGISITSSLLVSNTQVNHSEIAGGITAVNPLLRAPAVETWWSPFTAAGRAALDAEVTRQATTIAYIDDFKLLMVVTLLAVPLILILRRPERAAASPPAATAE
jgi:DHA2 family multidrug resistance protein